MSTWNRINISKSKLQELYTNQSLSIAKVANIFKCSTGPVHRSLREYRIPIRNLSEACTKITISKEQLRKWYFGEKMSMFEIANRLGCSRPLVVLKFRKFKLKSRGHLGMTKPIKLTKKSFRYLYYRRQLSLKKIARMTHCSEGGIERRFKNYNLESRGMKNRTCKYKKVDFSGNIIEKAHLIGFRLGDLNVINGVSIIVVRCSSTVPAQIRLIRSLFSKYTTPKTTAYIERKFKIPATNIVCHVNRSFDFLLPKEDRIPSWIFNKSETFLSFFAGYADAEGCFFLKKPKKCRGTWTSGFEIGTQQKRIIYELWRGLRRFDIYSPAPKISVHAGHISNQGSKNNKDVWHFTISRKSSVWKLLCLLRPYIKHQNKIRKIKELEANIISRNTIRYSHPINLSRDFTF